MIEFETEENVRDRETHPLVPEWMGKSIDAYLSVADALTRVIWALALVMATILTVLVVAQVVMRYVVGSIPAWGNELARYLTIWFSMLLIGVLVYSDTHLQVEILFQKLPIRMRRVVRSAELLVLIVFAGFLTRESYAWTMTSGYYSTTPALEQVTPFEFYMTYVYVVIPISGVLIMFFATAKLLEINYYPNTIQEDYASRFEIEGEASEEAADPTEDRDGASEGDGSREESMARTGELETEGDGGDTDG